MKKITLVKYLLPLTLSVMLTAIYAAAFQLYNNYKLNESEEIIANRIKGMESLDSVFFRDDIKLIADKGTIGSCSLFQDDIRLRGDNLVNHIKDEQTNLSIRICSYLNALQNIRITGVMQNLYMGFTELDSKGSKEAILLTSNSFPLHYKDTSLYTPFSFNTFELSFASFGIQRVIYVDNDILPHLKFNHSFFDPFTFNYQPRELMDFKSYLKDVQNTKFSVDKLKITITFLLFSALVILIWKLQIVSIYKIRAKLEFNSLIKNKGFLLIEVSGKTVSVVFCSDKNNLVNAKITYYTTYGVEVDQYDENTRFIRIEANEFTEYYRLIDSEYQRKASHTRVALSDNKIFDVIMFYKNNYTKDALTGLHNRSALKSLIQEHQHTETKMLMLLVDLDKFKQFNDTYGHDFGDTLLIHTADFFRKNFSREQDTVLRVGGEEFLLLFRIEPNANVNAFISSIKKRVLSFNQEAISLSGGLTIWDAELETFDAAHKRVDNLLYQSKHNGRAQITIDPRIQYYSDETDAQVEQIQRTVKGSEETAATTEKQEEMAFQATLQDSDSEGRRTILGRQPIPEVSKNQLSKFAEKLLSAAKKR